MGHETLLGAFGSMHLPILSSYISGTLGPQKQPLLQLTASTLALRQASLQDTHMHVHTQAHTTHTSMSVYPHVAL